MFRTRPFRNLTFATMFLVAGTLFAQRYQDRDHTMFHRPAAPPAAQKHQPMPSHAGNGHHSASTLTAHSHAGAPAIPSASGEAHGGASQAH